MDRWRIGRPTLRGIGLGAGLALLFTIGCSSAERVESHDTWPPQWRGFSLYESEGHYAYATGASSAESACDLFEEVAQDFRELTGATPSPALAIAIDDDDEYPIDDLRARLPALLEETRELTDEKLQLRVEALDEGMGGMGVPFETMLAMIPIVARPATFDPAFGEGAPRPDIIVLSTPARMNDAANVLIDAGLEKEGVGFGTRLLLAPMRPFLRKTLRTMLENEIRVALFARHARTLEGWSSERRQELTAAYEVELGVRAEEEMGTFEEGLPDGAAPPPPGTDDSGESAPDPSAPTSTEAAGPGPPLQRAP